MREATSARTFHELLCDMDKHIRKLRVMWLCTLGSVGIVLISLLDDWLAWLNTPEDMRHGGLPVMVGILSFLALAVNVWLLCRMWRQCFHLSQARRNIAVLSTGPGPIKAEHHFMQTMAALEAYDRG
jgi:hypothetical protein